MGNHDKASVPKPKRTRESEFVASVARLLPPPDMHPDLMQYLIDEPHELWAILWVAFSNPVFQDVHPAVEVDYTLTIEQMVERCDAEPRVDSFFTTKRFGRQTRPEAHGRWAQIFTFWFGWSDAPLAKEHVTEHMAWMRACTVPEFLAFVNGLRTDEHFEVPRKCRFIAFDPDATASPCLVVDGDQLVLDVVANDESLIRGPENRFVTARTDP